MELSTYSLVQVNGVFTSNNVLGSHFVDESER